jgi:hypothetical protein
MNLEEKLYTSTEVADILGVSLRSVYRYLDEGKLQAEVKTATGRHRFTKQNILDFLYPQGEGAPATAKEQTGEPEIKQEVKEESAPQPKVEEPQPVEEPVVEEAPQVQPEPARETPKVEEEETIDWLEKFRAAASKYKEEEAAIKVEETTKVEVTSDMTLAGTPTETEAPKAPEQELNYYRSLVGGLKDIAQNIDKSAKKASIDYAFTMNAGLSLHKPIKPFSVLHAYVRPEDKEFFERMLNLVPSNESNAQLCIISTKDKGIFDNAKEMHGLSVVSDEQLKEDLMKYGEEQLAKEL